MKKSILLNLIAAVGILLFNIFFWKETMGINILFYTIFMIGTLFWINPEGIASKPAIATSIGTLLIAIMVVINGSAFSKVMYFLSTLSMVGCIQFHYLRFIWYAFVMAFISILEGPKQLANQFSGSIPDLTASFRVLRLSVIPALIVPVFYGIYYIANPHFAEASSSFWNSFLTFLTPNISFERVLFFLLSILVVAGIVWRPIVHYFRQKQSEQKLDLIRSRKSKRGEVRQIIKTLGLKDEYRTAIILTGSLNFLLLIVNFLDIKYVWFGFERSAIENLSQYVHEGTYLLIVAILLAMMVVLYFFRANINFFPNNSILKYLTYGWIGQNVLLAFSVAIRNYHYIEYQGLAYKRIGVFIFLLLVFHGLLTLFQKVKNKRSTYFLLFRNSWALYAILILTTFVNWDSFITRYNINTETKGNIDLSFLLNEVSDKNLYLLIEHQEKLKNPENYTGHFNLHKVDDVIEHKISSFLSLHKDHSWLSWNLPDYRNKQYLNANNLSGF